MSKRIATFGEFVNEGGSVIKSSRSIREDEFPETLASIKRIIFPAMGISPDKEFSDFLLVGSTGKKPNPGDLSGDIDLAYNGNSFSATNGISFKECSNFLRSLLEPVFLAEFGFELEMEVLTGLNILSIGWPVKGDLSNGVVQLDLIPVSSMKWAKFIYYSPDYRVGESNWKSAHRNWLLSAALSAQVDVLSRNETDEIMDYKKPVMLLPSGLWLHTKTYRGIKKNRLKNPVKIKGSEEFLTDDPQEFIDYALGPGYTEKDVKTFEQVLDIMTSPNFKYKENLPEIKEKFINLLNRTKLPIPPETERLG